VGPRASLEAVEKACRTFTCLGIDVLMILYVDVNIILGSVSQMEEKPEL
jgi:hypothetical protein